MRSFTFILLTMAAATLCGAEEDRAVAHQSFQVIVVPRISVANEANELRIRANVALAVEIEEFEAANNAKAPIRTRREVRMVSAEPFATVTVSKPETRESTFRIVTITSLQ